MLNDMKEANGSNLFDAIFNSIHLFFKKICKNRNKCIINFSTRNNIIKLNKTIKLNK